MNLQSAKFWHSTESHCFLNPRLEQLLQEKFLRCFDAATKMYDGHIWLASSGRSSPKLIGLSKRALLASAEAVNHHLAVRSIDRWGLCLPQFHVGGLSIYARACSIGHEVRIFPCEWSPEAFVAWIDRERITLTSLVPTQVHDLVNLKRQPPLTLRVAVVGGDRLAPALYAEAKKLGWPLLPSFGMTEAGSQIATAKLESLAKHEIVENEKLPRDSFTRDFFPTLKLLSHLEAKVDELGRLNLRGTSLMTGHWSVEKFEFFKTLDWLVTDDRVEIHPDKTLRPLGRGQDFVKVLGEGFYLSDLEAKLEDRGFPLGFLVQEDDRRRGSRLVYFIEIDSLSSGDNLSHRLKKQVEEWNAQSFPPFRLSGFKIVGNVDRTPLGKVIRQSPNSAVLESYTAVGF